MARRYDKEIREFLKVYQEELIENVCQLVRIPSVAGEKKEHIGMAWNVRKRWNFVCALQKKRDSMQKILMTTVWKSGCMKNQEKNACF